MAGERVLDANRFFVLYGPFDESLFLEIGQGVRKHLSGDSLDPFLKFSEGQWLVCAQPMDNGRMLLPTEYRRRSDHGTPFVSRAPRRKFVFVVRHP